MLVVWMIALVVGKGATNIAIRTWDHWEDETENLPLLGQEIEGGPKNEFHGREEVVQGAGYKDEKKKMSKILEDCLEKCKVMDVGPQEKNPCSDGCQAQATALEEMKAKFQKTPLQYLLGTAVDKCWEGCEAQTGEEANKEGPSDKEKCKIGCSSMQKLQRNSYKDNQISSEESKESSNESKESSEASIKSSEENKKTAEVEDDFLMPNFFNIGNNEDVEESEFGGWHLYVIRPWSNVNDQIREHLNYMEEVRMQLMGWAMGQMESDDSGPQRSFVELRSQDETAPQWLYRSKELSPSPSFSDQASSSLTDLKQGASTTFYDLKNGATATLSQLRQGANAAFSDFKAEIGTALAGNSLMSNLLWILVGCGMVVMLASFFSWMYDAVFPNKSQDDGDYYKLKGSASPPALPSYEDCVKADKATLRDVEGLEEYFKVNLRYHAPMVVNISEEKIPLEKKEEI